jgi:hypothetical protein
MFIGEKAMQKVLSIVETLEVMSDPELMASLHRSMQEIKGEKLLEWESVKQKLGLPEE